MSVILQVLDDAYNYVSLISEEKFLLDDKFVHDAVLYIEKNDENLVNKENMGRAIKLLNYFNKTKLVLSGFTFDISSNSFKDIIYEIGESNEIKTDEGKGEEADGESEDNDEDQSSKIPIAEIALVEFFILDQDDELRHFTKSKIQQNRCKRLEPGRFFELVDELIELNFLREIKKKNKHGPKSNYYVRVGAAEYTIQQIDFLKRYNISLENDLLLKAEIEEIYEDKSQISPSM